MRVILREIEKGHGRYEVLDLDYNLLGFTNIEDKLMIAKDGCPYSKHYNIVAKNIIRLGD